MIQIRMTCGVWTESLAETWDEVVEWFTIDGVGIPSPYREIDETGLVVREYHPMGAA